MLTLMRHYLGRSLLPVLATLLIAGCGSAAGAPEAAAPTVAPVAPAIQAGDHLYIHDGFKGGAERLTVVDGASGERLRELPPGVAAPDWSALYAVEQAAGQTHVRALDAASGRALRETTLDGAYRMPTALPDSLLGGLSPDGRWLALVADSSQSGAGSTQFAVLDTSFKQPARLAKLAGMFHFDGLSNDAGSLFLTESLGADPDGKYQVRRYDMRLGALDPNVVVAKGESEIMNGVRQTAVASRDGNWLYSLYLNPEHGPFIHALDLSGPVAFCIDLPKSSMADLPRQARWSLVLGADGRALYAVNGAIGELVEVNLAGDFPEIARSRTLFAAPKPAGAAATAPSGTVAALSPDGATLYALGEPGLLAIDVKRLELRGRYLADWALDGLAISPDGARLYAASASVGKIVRLDPRAGTIAGEVPTAGKPSSVVRVES